MGKLTDFVTKTSSSGSPITPIKFLPGTSLWSTLSTTPGQDSAACQSTSATSPSAHSLRTRPRYSSSENQTAVQLSWIPDQGNGTFHLETRLRYSSSWNQTKVQLIWKPAKTTVQLIWRPDHGTDHRTLIQGIYQLQISPII